MSSIKNINGSDANIFSSTTDFGNDAKRFQIQSLAAFTMQFRNRIPTLGNVVASTAQILSNTTRGFLTGRRPVSGQVFPRGVYNR